MFAAEKAIRSSDFAGIANITGVPDGNTTMSYETTKCITTCFGFDINEPTPPFEAVKVMASDVLILIFSFLATVRVLCLGVELTLLGIVQARFEHLFQAEVTRASGSNKITPVAGAETKALKDFTKEEFDEWLTKEGFEGFLGGEWRAPRGAPFFAWLADYHLFALSRRCRLL